MTISCSLATLPLAAALGEYPSLSDSIVYQLTGLVVVFTALSLIWLMLEVFGFFFKRQNVAVPVPAHVEVPVVEEQLSDELVAAITAAVHVTLGDGHRIATIVQAETPTQDWAREGRRQIHSARKVR